MNTSKNGKESSRTEGSRKKDSAREFYLNACSWYRSAAFMTDPEKIFPSAPLLKRTRFKDPYSLEDMIVGVICIYFSLEMGCKALLNRIDKKTYSLAILKSYGHDLGRLMTQVEKEVRARKPEETEVIETIDLLYRGYNLESIDAVALRYPAHAEKVSILLKEPTYHLRIFLKQIKSLMSYFSRINQ